MGTPRQLRTIRTSSAQVGFQRDLVEVMHGAATTSKTHKIGVRGWPQADRLVHYSRPHDFWFVSVKSDEREIYWNVLGPGDPFRGSTAVAPSIELNVAWLPSAQSSLTGRPLVDDQGRRWVGHTGHLRGGTKGLTIAAFLAFYGRSEVVHVNGAQKVMVLLGCLERPDPLVTRLGEIAHAAREIRQRLRARK